jgi:hypothetical protein
MSLERCLLSTRVLPVMPAMQSFRMPLMVPFGLDELRVADGEAGSFNF